MAVVGNNHHRFGEKNRQVSSCFGTSGRKSGSRRKKKDNNHRNCEHEKLFLRSLSSQMRLGSGLPLQTASMKERQDEDFASFIIGSQPTDCSTLIIEEKLSVRMIIYESAVERPSRTLGSRHRLHSLHSASDSSLSPSASTGIVINNRISMQFKARSLTASSDAVLTDRSD